MAASCPTLVDPPTVSVVIELIRTRQGNTLINSLSHLLIAYIPTLQHRLSRSTGNFLLNLPLQSSHMILSPHACVSPTSACSCIPSLASKRALMSAAAAEADPDIALALVCALADTLVVPVFMQLLQPHEHLIGMSACPPLPLPSLPP